MKTAHLKFIVFAVGVLALPFALMSQHRTDLTDLGKLAMILSPSLLGLVLKWGLGDRGRRPVWRAVGAAAIMSLVVTGLAVAVAFGVGAASFARTGAPAQGLAAAMGVGALTSILEELGWAGGGLALAVKAFGRRTGVLVLGLIWAAWHLVPTFLKVGLFPSLEAASPTMLAAFVIACLIYRELLTRWREQAQTWLAAAVGHAAPNILLAALITAGLGGFDQPGHWRFFPAPGGLVFPVLALAAVWIVGRRSGPSLR